MNIGSALVMAALAGYSGYLYGRLRGVREAREYVERFFQSRGVR